MGFTSITVTRSYEQVVHQITEAIQRGTLASGQKLPTERELAESFGVGRGVVREAVKVLTAMGLVESRQGSGTFVRTDPVPSVSRALTLSVTADTLSVLRLLEFREVLEAMSARFAAQRRTAAQVEAIHRYAEQSADVGDDFDAFGVADDLFHATVNEAADNPYLSAVLGTVRQMQSEAVALMIQQPGSITTAAGHHRRVASAIAGGAADEAAAGMAEHVAYVASVVRSILPVER